ncbi:hypothetical protein THOM_1418 [Trachipleistophora hominis]|uniref:Uncharacterized protein n=1 Tax=Trachipleistophora hominis TaxID=72359 RepID=L7JW22_TRAHO|nr:hypothetical protein THOM_1418 [Trachipleistophora hominis]
MKHQLNSEKQADRINATIMSPEFSATDITDKKMVKICLQFDDTKCINQVNGENNHLLDSGYKEYIDKLKDLPVGFKKFLDDIEEFFRINFEIYGECHS